MDSITKMRRVIKGKMRRWPMDIVVGVLICLICFCAFALGWVARSQVVYKPATIEEIELGGGWSESLYVGSVNSDSYHYIWCSGAERINPENRRYFQDLEAARAAGYQPAGNCPGLE